MENTTNGEKGKAPTASASMVENSPNSAQSDKRNTRKTVKLTLEQAYEILTQALSYVEEAGGEIELLAAGYTDDVAFRLQRTRLLDGKIIPVKSADKASADNPESADIGSADNTGG